MFSEKTFDFLIENKLHDSREWYAEHKTEFRKYVFEPLAELVCALAPTMNAIDNDIVCEPKTCKTISRINRDTRFSKDKSLYRSNMWISFCRPKDKTRHSGMPGYWVEISPDVILYGCGMYCPPTQVMDECRKLIIAGDKDFKAMKKFVESDNEFVIDGNIYKRTKFPEQKPELRNWLDRKSICVIGYSKDFSLLYSDDFSKKIESDFKALKPAYDFFMKCERLK